MRAVAIAIAVNPAQAIPAPCPQRMMHR